MAPLSLQRPLAGEEQPEPAAGKQPRRDQQAPHGEEKQRQDFGVLGFDQKHPFDDTDRRQQADRASGETAGQDDEFLWGHGHGIGKSLRTNRLAVNRTGRKPENGGRTRDRTLDLSRVKGTL